MTHETDGQVIITWPAAHNPPTALPIWGVAIDDADSGVRLVDVVALRLELGSKLGLENGPIEVVLTRLADTDGKPVGTASNRLAFTDEYTEWLASHVATGPDALFPGQKFRTAEFRYIVAEMRVAEEA